MATEWKDTKEQRAFLERVLQVHTADSARRKGTALPDLKPSELAPVPSTRYRVGRETATAVGQMLAAARRDLKADKAAGDPDAAKTLELTISSGYRSRARQNHVWRDHFITKYYNATAADRKKYYGNLPGGEHGDAATQYMVKYIRSKTAAPGYSNHQAGLAVDLFQERTKGTEIKNSTDLEAKRAWKRTWFYGWLRKHGAEYHFKEFGGPRGEPWHWTHDRKAQPGPRPTELPRAGTTQLNPTAAKSKTGRGLIPRFIASIKRDRAAVGSTNVKPAAKTKGHPATDKPQRRATPTAASKQHAATMSHMVQRRANATGAAQQHAVIKSRATTHVSTSASAHKRRAATNVPMPKHRTAALHPAPRRATHRSLATHRATHQSLATHRAPGSVGIKHRAMITGHGRPHR